MKTSNWTPPAPTSFSQEPGRLGLTQRFVLDARGFESVELSAIAILQMCLECLRQDVPFIVSALNGDVMLTARRGEITGNEDFKEALSLYDQFMLRERRFAIDETLNELRAQMQQEG